MESLKGMHHVTAITSSAEKNYEFFTYVLGMRLVKKTVNQDDISTYHLFFADDRGSAGTDMTFFDFQGIPKGTHGTDEIHRTSFRVPDDAALDYWVKRFDRLEIKHDGIRQQFDRNVLPFTDFDGQLYQLISDEGDTGVAAGIPWQKGPIPLEYAITGLGPIILRVSNIDYMKQVMEKALGFREVAKDGSVYLFEVGEGGNGARVIIEHNAVLPRGMQGFGTIHHSAFRVEDRSVLEDWINHMESMGFSTSGYVDRFYFESLYARVAPGILFEFATDGPGFMDDEPYETLGEKLALPPFLEPKREQIESYVRHIDTMRSDQAIEKEYE
ncbi:ring-cleaving dioxygenase [Bhargavaea massiliensis]|uniref:ring-cleaving dioxygenase n=1 Tax=Bhargavaea massiliensis TaxID=2697500 RepID=UPI001BCAB175|nr:ring-cleaving dioxygenase [Bhargavaea massiliensis]